MPRESMHGLPLTGRKQEEARALHEVFLKLMKPDHVPEDQYLERDWMKDTVLEKTMLMFPQERK